MDALRQLLATNPHEDLDEAFRDLPADADDATRQALAEWMAPFVGANRVGDLGDQGASVIILMAMNVLVVVLVWRVERAKRSRPARTVRTGTSAV